MKKIYLFLASFLFCFVLNAQYYYEPHLDAGQNPGNLNKGTEYPQGGGLASGWKAILAGIPSTDTWSSITSIPFDFEFNGQKVTHFKASSTGVVTFDTGTTMIPDRINETLPSSKIPDNSIMLWGLFPAVNPDLSDYPDVLTKTFGTAPNRQFYIFYNTYADSGIQEGWSFWSIILEETSNNIYFVDQRTYCYTGSSSCTGNLSLTIGIQLDSNTAWQVSGSPNIASITSGSAQTTDNGYYRFIYGTQPLYDLTTIALDLGDYYLLDNAPFEISGTIRNYGTQTINSFDINYSVEGGSIVTDHLSGYSISMFDDATFSIPTKWNPAVGGEYDLKVWASNLNSQSDENAENDTAAGFTIVADSSVERIPLHEVFTSSTCGPCVNGNIQLGAVLDNYDEASHTVIKYQMSWPGDGDPYYTEEGGTRRTYYGINSVPNLWVDGSWGQNPSSYSTGIYDSYKENPSYIDLKATHTIEEQTVSVDITIDPLENFYVDDLRLYAGIVENTTYENVGTNGEDEFEFVMKKMLPNASGSTITLLKDTKKEKTLSWRFRGDYRLPDDASDPITHSKEHSVEEFSDLSVVIWIQNYDTKEVYQSVWSVEAVSGIDDQDGEGIVGMFPNPVESDAFVRFQLPVKSDVNIEVYDMLGHKIYSEKEYNVSGTHTKKLAFEQLQKGPYILKLSTDRHSYSRVFIKQ